MTSNTINFSLLFIFLTYIFFIRKKALNYKILSEKSFSELDYYLKKKQNILISLTKDLDEFFASEETLYTKIKSLAKQEYDEFLTDEKIEHNLKVESIFKEFFNKIDKNLELSISEKITHLRRNLLELDNNIIKTKKRYNNHTKEYNEYINSLPQCLFLQLFKFNPEPLYKSIQKQKKY